MWLPSRADPAARRVELTLRAAGKGRLPLRIDSPLCISHRMRLAMFSHKTAAAPPASSLEPAYRLGPDVVLIPVEDGSARLLDFAGETFALSEVAARMLTETLNPAVRRP